MKIKLSIVICFLFFIMLYIHLTRNEADIVTSTINNQKYVVRNETDKQDAADLLANLENIILYFSKYLYEKRNSEEIKEKKKYVELLHNGCKNIQLSEGTDNNSYTTYTINKGEKMVFCLRSKITNKLHDINLLTFVTIHEMAHIACPEKDHTPLFVDIFKFLLYQAVHIKLYIYQDYRLENTEYCGLTLDQTPI